MKIFKVICNSCSFEALTTTKEIAKKIKKIHDEKESKVWKGIIVKLPKCNIFNANVIDTMEGLKSDRT